MQFDPEKGQLMPYPTRNFRSPGFGLLGLLGSISLISLATISTLGFLRVGFQGSKDLRSSVELSRLLSHIQLIMENADLCAGALQDGNGQVVTFDPTANITDAVSEIRLGSSSIKTGTTYDGALRVTDISLKELDPTKRSTQTINLVTYNRYVAELTLGVMTMSGLPIRRHFTLIVLTNPGTATNPHMVAGCSNNSISGRSQGTLVFAYGFRTNRSGRPLTIMSGPTDAIVTVDNVDPPPEAQFPDNNLDGLKCDEAAGWQVVGCWNAVRGGDNDLTMIPNGCVTNEFDQHRDIDLSIACVRQQ